MSLANGELVVYQREAGACSTAPQMLCAPQSQAGAVLLQLWFWATSQPAVGLGIFIYM